MEISFCSHPSTNKVIATKFGTWHDSWAVVACAKFCCDMINCNWIRAKWFFHRIWIVMEKSLVKWVPEWGTHLLPNMFREFAGNNFTDYVLSLNSSKITCYSSVFSDFAWGMHMYTVHFVSSLEMWSLGNDQDRSSQSRTSTEHMASW